MFIEDSTEQFLMDMSSNRGDSLAMEKAGTDERYIKLAREKQETLERFSKDFTDEQKKLFLEFEEADAAVLGMAYHYVYMQGLKDGITLGKL